MGIRESGRGLAFARGGFHEVLELDSIVACSQEREGSSVMCRSEVAQLCKQIELEFDAMQRGMTGVALGNASHTFIRTRMARIGACQQKLANHVGKTAANHIIGDLYTKTMEQGLSSDVTP